MTAQTWVALVVGLLAAAGVVGTLWQRQRSEATDRFHRLQHEARVEWWKRYQWAVEQSDSADSRTSERGYVLVEALVESPLVTSSELGIIEAVATMNSRAIQSLDVAEE